MPRHPDTVTEPNTRLQQARLNLPSPVRPRQRMSRPELAIAVNALLDSRGVLDVDVDANYVGKLEAGKHNWIRDERRRQAFRDVLNVESDEDLGFYYTRHSFVDAEIVSRRNSAASPSSLTATFIKPGTPAKGKALLDSLTSSFAKHLDALGTAS